MYPTSAAGGVEDQESVAKSLIEKLGLYEESTMTEGAPGEVT